MAGYICRDGHLSGATAALVVPLFWIACIAALMITTLILGLTIPLVLFGVSALHLFGGLYPSEAVPTGARVLEVISFPIEAFYFGLIVRLVHQRVSDLESRPNYAIAISAGIWLISLIPFLGTLIFYVLIGRPGAVTNDGSGQKGAK